jgi:hypothetical protein
VIFYTYQTQKPPIWLHCKTIDYLWQCRMLMWEFRKINASKRSLGERSASLCDRTSTLFIALKWYLIFFFLNDLELFRFALSFEIGSCVMIVTELCNSTEEPVTTKSLYPLSLSPLL